MMAPVSASPCAMCASMRPRSRWSRPLLRSNAARHVGPWNTARDFLGRQLMGEHAGSSSGREHQLLVLASSPATLAARRAALAMCSMASPSTTRGSPVAAMPASSRDQLHRATLVVASAAFRAPTVEFGRGARPRREEITIVQAPEGGEEESAAVRCIGLLHCRRHFPIPTPAACLFQWQVTCQALQGLSVP